MSKKKTTPKTKRPYNRNTIRGKLFSVRVDMRHMEKIFSKLQKDVANLTEAAKKR